MVGSLGSSTGINVCRGNRPLSLRFLLTCGSSNHVGFHKNKRKNSHSPSSVSSHLQKAARSWLSSAWPSICYDPNFHKRPSPLAVLTAPLPLVFSLAQPVGSCHDRHAHLLLFPPLPKLADSFLFQRLYHQTQTDLFSFTGFKDALQHWFYLLTKAGQPLHPWAQTSLTSLRNT